MTEVYFQKPNLKDIFDGGNTFVDMHYHTKYSVDSIASPINVLKKAKKLGLGVAITDHNTIGGAKEMWKYIKEIFIIPGIEITDVTGIHTLVYFYDYSELEEFFNKEIKPTLYKMPFFISKNIKYVLERAREYNCMVCMAHPFSPGSTNINNIKWDKKMMDSIDLIEVINAYNLRARNVFAMDFANKMNKGMTGGSDGHSIGELGSAVTIAEGDTVEDFMMSLKNKRGIVIGKESNIIKKAIQSVGKETTAIKNNLRTHNQMNRLRSMFYLNAENIRSKIGNSRERFSLKFKK